MKTLETLKAARNLIADPKNWIKKELAINANGEWVYPTNPSACGFCITGLGWAK